MISCMWFGGATAIRQRVPSMLSFNNNFIETERTYCTSTGLKSVVLSFLAYSQLYSRRHNFGTFSSVHSETQYPLAVHLHFFQTLFPEIPQQPLSFFLTLDFPALDSSYQWNQTIQGLSTAGLLHSTQCLQGSSMSQHDLVLCSFLYQPRNILPTFRLSVHQRIGVVGLFLLSGCYDSGGNASLIFYLPSSFIETECTYHIIHWYSLATMNHSELSCTSFCVGHTCSLGCYLGAELPSHMSPYVYLLGCCQITFQSGCIAPLLSIPIFYPQREKISLSYFAILEG